MTDGNKNGLNDLPATLGESLSSVPAALIPRSIRAIDRLIGATIDVPVAWLNQQKAKIEAQTAAHQAVEKAIGEAVAKDAAIDPDVIAQATNALVRKAYRKHDNLTAAAKEAVEELKSDDHHELNEDHTEDIDEDWLNVFERFAEDASTERMQKLWGRVLAGEIRKPGRYSTRTLRFLSEFSQKEAEIFQEVSKQFFGNIGPKKIVKPDEKNDIRDLLLLEESGIIQGASGLGLSYTLIFDKNGFTAIPEGPIALGFKGMPGAKVETQVLALTSLGSELISLLSDRDPMQAAKNVGLAMRTKSTSLGLILPCINNEIYLNPIEILWSDQDSSTP